MKSPLIKKIWNSEGKQSHNYPAGDYAETYCHKAFFDSKLQKRGDEGSCPGAGTGNREGDKKEKPEKLPASHLERLFIAAVNYFLKYPAYFIEF